MVAFADQLAKIDTDGIEPMAHIGGLQNGIYGKNWEAKYDEYIAKLKAAGVQEILDTVTKQYNDYTSSKK